MIKSSTIHYFLLFFFLFCNSILGQEPIKISEKLIGYWEGAFIKNNSYQKIEIDFSKRDGEIFGLQIMDEWHPTFGEFEVPVKIDSTGQISFGTGYGKAELILDEKNLEIVGQLEGFNPSIYVHLKKVANRPSPNYELKEVSITSDEVELYGHLHLPFSNPTKTAVILVGGRGCGADETKYNLYAKFLRKYGIAVLAYQKRGTGSSTGNCDLATINDLSTDLVNVKSFLETYENSFEKIGVLGISAGGWTMTMAEESVDFDFMMGIVGPATSVRDQQMQSASYGADFYQLEPKAKANLLTYTDLMFDAKPSKRGFETMQALLKSSEDEGWSQLLEETDIPKSVSEIKNLWVRRHDFDPKRTLQSFSKPLLAIYGDRDWIVPKKENTALLKEYFLDNPNDLTTVIAYNAEHGMETEAKWVELAPNQSYWHFYRISPQVRIGIVDFLNKHGLKK